MHTPRTCRTANACILVRLAFNPKAVAVAAAPLLVVVVGVISQQPRRSCHTLLSTEAVLLHAQLLAFLMPQQGCQLHAQLRQRQPLLIYSGGC
jgi:hypothetical protein